MLSLLTILSPEFIATTSITLVNIGWIAGMGIWANTPIYYTFTNAYNFGWFVSITSMLTSGFGVCYFGCPWVNNKTTFAPKYRSHVWASISLIYSIFSLSSASSIADTLSLCNTTRSGQNCNGISVATAFGFTSFVLWVIQTILHARLAYLDDQKKNDKDPVMPPTPPTTPKSENESYVSIEFKDVITPTE
jgi:hypothetical protein